MKKWLLVIMVICLGSVTVFLASKALCVDPHTFLENNGWIVSDEPVQKGDFMIPGQFDTTFDSYNALQKQGGYDLTPYKGKTVQRVTYEVYNFNPDAFCYANILLDGTKIIGGEIIDVGLNGQMLPLGKHNLE